MQHEQLTTLFLWKSLSEDAKVTEVAEKAAIGTQAQRNMKDKS